MESEILSDEVETMFTNWLAQTDSTLWMPPPASDLAEPVDSLFYFIMGLSIFFFLLIFVLMVFFAIKYRRRDPAELGSGPTHSTALELVWTIIPLILVMVIFVRTIPGYYVSYGPRENALQVNVTGSKWRWDFEYENNHIDDELHVTVDQPVQLVITSQDVIHSVFIPAFRVKKDAVPGRFNRVAFTPTRVGRYPLLCAEYCGTEHSSMLTTVVVHEAGGFDSWLADAARSFVKELTDEQYRQWRVMKTSAELESFLTEHPALEEFRDKLRTPVMYGQEIYESKGCNQCHSVDGTQNVGPTLKGVWGRTAGGETVLRGEVPLSDYLNAQYTPEDYIVESIHEPGAKIVRGMNNAMPSQKGKISTKEIGALIEYLKTLE